MEEADSRNGEFALLIPAHDVYRGTMTSAIRWFRTPNIRDVLRQLHETPLYVRFLGEPGWLVHDPEHDSDKPSDTTLLLQLALLERFLRRVKFDKRSEEERLDDYTLYLGGFTRRGVKSKKEPTVRASRHLVMTAIHRLRELATIFQEQTNREMLDAQDPSRTVLRHVSGTPILTLPADTSVGDTDQSYELFESRLRRFGMNHDDFRNFQNCSTDLDRLWDRIEGLKDQERRQPQEQLGHLGGQVIRECLMDGPLYKLPFGRSSSFDGRMPNVRLFRLLVRVLVQQVLEVAAAGMAVGQDPEQTAHLIRLVLALVYHVENVDERGRLLKMTQHTLCTIAGPVNLKTVLMALLQKLDDPLVTIDFQRSSQLWDASGSWSTFVESVRQSLLPGDWASAVTRADTKPMPGKPAAPSLEAVGADTEKEYLHSSHTLHYDYEWLGQRSGYWTALRSSERRILQRVKQGGEIREHSGNIISHSGVAVVQASLLHLPLTSQHRPIEGKVSEREGRTYVDFPFGDLVFKGGDTFTTVSTESSRRRYVTLEDWHSHQPEDDGSWTFDDLIGWHRVFRLTKRVSFPAWYPVRPLHVEDGRLVEGLGLYYRSKELPRPEGQRYLSTEAVQHFVRHCSHVTAHRIGGRLDIEATLWADPEVWKDVDGVACIPRGIYGLAFMRPTEAQMNAAWDAHQRQL